LTGGLRCLTIATPGTWALKENLMKAWIAFLSGGVFILALVVTCGSRNSGPGGPGGPANAADGAGWEYAWVQNTYDKGATATMPVGVNAPVGLSSCLSQVPSCMLNAFGADGWELSAWDSSASYILKRPK
jgi:hypothetical protein